MTAIAVIPVNSPDDIIPLYRGTPFEELLAYHNLGKPQPETTGDARMLIVACMDNRKELHIPPEFAYVIRTAGANVTDSEFSISYAIAVGGVRHIAVIAHTHCGMAHVDEKRDAVIAGLVNHAAWTHDDASAHFDAHVAHYHVGDPAEFALSEAVRLDAMYPPIHVAPFLYSVEDDRLSILLER